MSEIIFGIYQQEKRISQLKKKKECKAICIKADKSPVHYVEYKKQIKFTWFKNTRNALHCTTNINTCTAMIKLTFRITAVWGNAGKERKTPGFHPGWCSSVD